MKSIKKVVLTIFFLIGFLLILGVTSKASSSDLYLNNLTFNAKLNKDGSMDVTEVWYIGIQNTNTLYKTFEIDNSKYSSITNIKVSDITDKNNPKNFTEINKEMYHVTKDCYYGLINKNNMYEIAWGVSILGDTIKTYKISYKVNDVIKAYNDCDELYWQFIGSSFEIPAKNVSGTITLPEAVKKQENIKVWAHGQLNGNIEIVSTNTVKFSITDFKPGKYVETRIVTLDNIFTSISKIQNKNMLQNIIDEETRWANNANNIRKAKEVLGKIMPILGLVLDVGVIILLVINTFKCTKILKENKAISPEIKLEYYRDIPDEASTPSEIGLLYYMNKMTNVMSKIISATILDLVFKKYIKFETEEQINGKEEIKIEILENTNIKLLKQDEKAVYDFLLKVKSKKKNEDSFKIKDIEKYIKKNPSKILKLVNLVIEKSKDSQEEKENYDIKRADEGDDWKNKVVFYLFIPLFLSLFNLATINVIIKQLDLYMIIDLKLFTLITLFIYIILGICIIINSILAYNISKRFKGLTQKGANEKEKWEALKRYIENFSMLDDKELPSLELWEKYLIYATVFGISKKVLKQLKIKYPEIENGDFLKNGTYINLMYADGLSSNLISSITTSVSRGYSIANYSSSRWPVEEDFLLEEAGGGRWPVVGGGR